MPNFIREKIGHRTNLHAIVHNTGWLFADKILRLSLGLFVGVWIARYLGPDQFGLWNYSIAFSGIFSIFVTLGLDGIVIRELVKNPKRHNALLGSAFGLKLMGGIFALLFSMIALILISSDGSLIKWLVGLSTAGFIFQSLNVIDLYFQSKVQSKYTVYSTNGALLIMTLVKVSLIINSAPLIAFAWAGLGEVLLTSFFLTTAYQFNHFNIRDWHFKLKTAKDLLKDSWPLILSGFAIVIYMRIDQIMISHILNNKEVGLFSAAVRLSEAWYFIPLAIVSSVTPAIFTTKNQNEILYLQRLQKLYNLMVQISLAVAFIVTFLANWIIFTIFGRAYQEAGLVLAIHIWTSIFVSLGVASSNWFLIENLQKLLLVRTIFGACINILLNLVLIPIFSIAGAAFASLVSAVFVNFLIDYWNNKTRNLFYMKLYSFNFLRFFSIKFGRP